MSGAEGLIGNAATHATDFAGGTIRTQPATGVVIVTCMDARVNHRGCHG